MISHRAGVCETVMDYSNEDIELMLRFQDGEESCFEQLVQRHKSKVFNLAYRFLGNYHDAEDLSQRVFIKIYQIKSSYKPQAKFTTWLYTICKNMCLNELRDKKPHAVSVEENIELQEDTVAMQIADTKNPSPLESVLDNELNQVVKEAVDLLPENQKMAVILYRYEQLSYEEISKIMNCSAKAVKSLLHRAKLNLKEKLEGYVKISA